jgi:transglutaminase-like putative cysteine protease
MKKYLLLFLLILIPLTLANYDTSESLTTKTTITSQIEIEQGSTSLDYIKATLNYYPKEYNHQTIEDHQTSSSPTATETENEFTWETISTSYELQTITTTKTTNNLNKVYTTSTFPITEIPEEYEIYTQESEFIDLNDDIEQQAQDIIQGETDLYQVVFNLADWVNQNIQYNLTTMNSESVQTSSWVLENREGVCDEITNLFISFCRSVGIPARFISGVAYTNINDNFGAHGWAEVYIDDQWIPFDVTYGTFGWVDPSHVKFNEQQDPSTPSIEFEWSGNGFSITNTNLNAETILTGEEGTIDNLIDIEITPLANQVGPSSYVPVQIEIKNNQDYYVPVKVALTKAPELLESNTQAVLLEPNQEKSTYFTIIIPEETEEGYTYTTIIEVTTPFSELTQTELEYSSNYDTISKEQAEELEDLLPTEDSTLTEVSIECTTDKESYYQGETATITCNLDGSLEETQVCFQNECKQASEQIQFTTSDVFSQRQAITVQKGENQLYEYITLNFVTIPEINIELSQTSFDYSEIPEITFTITTESEITNLTLNIKNYGIINIPKVSQSYDFTIPLPIKQFPEQEIMINSTYYDSLNKEYSKTTTTQLQVTNIPIYIKILTFIRNLINY